MTDAMHPQEIRDWRPLKIEPFGRTARLDAFTRRAPGARPDVHILLPGIDARYLSGGPNTAFLLGAEIARLGYRVCFDSLQCNACAFEVFAAHLVNRLHIAPTLVERFRLADFNSGLSFQENDRIMATASWTMPAALELCANGAFPRPAYLIQDLEPLFLGFGIEHASLMDLYGADFLPVINTSFLANMLMEIGSSSFADEEFKKKALVFEPAVDRRSFHFEPKRHKKKVLGVYTRFHQRQARNLTGMSLDAIARAVKKGLLHPDRWEVRCFGAQEYPPLRFGNGLTTIMLPWLDFDAYAAAVRQCDAGIALMCSPHTGYMPLELAACGAETVTNTYLAKTGAALRRLSPHIHPAAANMESLTNALIKAIEIVEAREEAPAGPGAEDDGLRLPKTWPDAFLPVMRGIESWMQQKNL